MTTGQTIPDTPTRETNTAESTTSEVDTHEEATTTTGRNYIFIFVVNCGKNRYAIWSICLLIHSTMNLDSPTTFTATVSDLAMITTSDEGSKASTATNDETSSGNLV